MRGVPSAHLVHSTHLPDDRHAGHAAIGDDPREGAAERDDRRTACGREDGRRRAEEQQARTRRSEGSERGEHAASAGHRPQLRNAAQRIALPPHEDAREEGQPHAQVVAMRNHDHPASLEVRPQRGEHRIVLHRRPPAVHAELQCATEHE